MIRVLDKHIANMIAAGEVIVSPINVVKELVENSIDASSTNIEITIENGGKNLIEIKDNGLGISHSDVPIAFIRHATSKIESEKDLFNIMSFGFRGEALPSIASVSKVLLETSIDSKSGTEFIIEGGEIKKYERSIYSKGTRIVVRDLFFNTPARFKYLKNEKYENASVINVVARFAYIESHISFKLIIDNKVVFKSSGLGKQIEILGNIYDFNIAKNMIRIDKENLNFRIEGYISPGFIYKSNKNYINFYINNRQIRSFFLVKSLISGYSSTLANDKYPIAYINIIIDPSLIDVNVHPTKQEVKISLERELGEFLKNTVYGALIEKPLSSAKNLTSIYENSKRIENIESSKTYTTESLFSLINDDEEINVVDVHETNIILANLIVVGQVKDSYILSYDNLNMYLIDQHAARERVYYEEIKKSFNSNNILSIALLLEVEVIFSLDKKEILEERLSSLTKIGFEYYFKENNVCFTAISSIIAEFKIHDILSEIIEKMQDDNFQIDDTFNDRIAKIACMHSVKANTMLTNQDMKKLIRDLDTCEIKYTCPHGRPIFIKYGFSDIEKSFKRTGF